MRGQPGFFDIDDRLKRLSDLGDQLETFRSAVDFEVFRPELNAALSFTDQTEGGRPPFDPVLMFKILVIQATNNLSDERAEFLINGSWDWGWRTVFRTPARSGCSGRS
jgi:transposase, IS5 family